MLRPFSKQQSFSYQKNVYNIDAFYDMKKFC